MFSENEIRSRLIARRTELLQRYASELEGGQHDDTLTPEPVDLANEQAADRLLTLLEDRDLHSLREVVGALQRLDRGSYGDCSRCGEPIAQVRLAVLPTATYCFQCAVWTERHAHGGPHA